MNNNTKFSNLKKRLKAKENSSNPIVRFIIKTLRKISDILRKTKRFLTNKEYRSVVCMQIFHPKDVHQTTQLTCLNRYPEIFAACRQYFQGIGKSNIRILSFGCCTGEEVVTLREYFPEAEIVGAEINKYSLDICRKRKLDEKITFIESSHKNITAHGPYDAVFCMAVLQRTPHVIEKKNITDLSKIYPFEKFEKQIDELDSYIKKDGLLIVHITQYDLGDADIASKYEAYGNYGYSCGLFDKNNKLVAIDEKRNSIFVKKNI